MLQDREVAKALRDCPNITQLTDGNRLYLKFPKRAKGGDGAWAWVGEPSWKLDYTKPNKVKVEEVKCPTTGNVTKRTVPVRDSFTLGVYSKYTCKQARDEAEAIREALKPRMVDGVMVAGIDPKDAHKTMVAVQTRAAEGAALVALGKAAPGTFRHATEMMLDEFRDTWGTEYLRGLEADLRLRAYPTIGDLQCSDLTERHFMDITNALIEGRMVVVGKAWKDPAGAKRVLHAAKRVMGFAKRKGLSAGDPFRDMGEIKDIVGPLKRHVPRAAATTPAGIADVMQKFDAQPWRDPGTRRLAWVNAQTFQRPANCAHMRWQDVDLDKQLWTIPASAMKRMASDQTEEDAPHYVPLSRQTVALLREQKEYQRTVKASRADYVFHNRNKATRLTHPITDKHLVTVMRRELKIGDREHSAHGFRAVGRSLGRAIGLSHNDLEAHLAHMGNVDMEEHKGKVDATGNMTGTYMRETFVNCRFFMAQVWSDYLDHLVHGTPFHFVPMTQIEREHPRFLALEPAQVLAWMAKRAERMPAPAADVYDFPLAA